MVLLVTVSLMNSSAGHQIGPTAWLAQAGGLILLRCFNDV